MTIDLINQLKEELARIETERVAIEKLILLGSNLPPPRLGPPHRRLGSLLQGLIGRTHLTARNGQLR